MNIKDLPEYYQEQARAQLQAGRIALGAPCCDATTCKQADSTTADTGNEKALQSQCEALMVKRGYWRMTVDNLVKLLCEDSGHCKGFFWHLHKAQGNPIQPDITVIAWPNVKPALMVELKAGDNPAYQPGQKEAITAGLWRVCFTLAGLEILLAMWEENELDKEK